ncbi:unnamed protein product [Leptosia nina]|uniref:Uncharacterized protein n=1 Tax=Leptosia nina TaxID=320188 RepID=A0AAV1ITG6_9NEOP
MWVPRSAVVKIAAFHYKARGRRSLPIWTGCLLPRWVPKRTLNRTASHKHLLKHFDYVVGVPNHGCAVLFRKIVDDQCYKFKNNERQVNLDRRCAQYCHCPQPDTGPLRRRRLRRPLVLVAQAPRTELAAHLAPATLKSQLNT